MARPIQTRSPRAVAPSPRTSTDAPSSRAACATSLATSASLTESASSTPRASSPRRSAPSISCAIARASASTGVDFSYLLGEARLESSLDPSARATGSSAAGLYQFTGGTWLRTLEAHGAEHGLGWAAGSIANGRVSDPALRAQIMALRYDPDASAAMAAELASDNRAALNGALGREPDAGELYLAHFLGAGAAGQFLNAMARDPGQSAAALFPAAAGANKAIFYDGAGAPRSLGSVMDLLRGRLAGAMDQPLPSESADAFALSPMEGAGSFGTAAASPPEPRQRPSMADTLAATFGGGERSLRFTHAGWRSGHADGVPTAGEGRDRRGERRNVRAGRRARLSGSGRQRHGGLRDEQVDCVARARQVEVPAVVR